MWSATVKKYTYPPKDPTNLNLKIPNCQLTNLAVLFPSSHGFWANFNQILAPPICIVDIVSNFPTKNLSERLRCCVSLGDGWGGVYGTFTSAIGLAQLAHWPSSLHDTWRWSTFRLWSSHRRWTWCAHHRGCGSISWGQVQVVFVTSKGFLQRCLSLTFPWQCKEIGPVLGFQRPSIVSWFFKAQNPIFFSTTRQNGQNLPIVNPQRNSRMP